MKPNHDTPEKTLQREIDKFSGFLKKKGLKLTTQRIVVARKVFSLNTHFTADSLSDMLKDHRYDISKATIYRIIGILVDANLLIEHDFGEGYKFYEHTNKQEHHDHIICQDCNRIVEFYEPKIEELQAKAAKQAGFQIAGHRLNIYGICQKKPDCSHYRDYLKQKS